MPRSREKALELDPLNTFYARTMPARNWQSLGDFPEAEQEYAKAISVDPTRAVHLRAHRSGLPAGREEPGSHRCIRESRDYSGGQQDKIVLARLRLWRQRKKIRCRRGTGATSLVSSLKRQSFLPLHVALVYNSLGDKEHALASLEKAYLARDEYMVYLHIYPEFRNLHSERRFQALERGMSF